jgi:hypothetical protein
LFLVLLESLWWVGFNEADFKKIDLKCKEILNFKYFFIGNSIKLLKNGLEGKISWVTSSHFGQWHRLYYCLMIEWVFIHNMFFCLSLIKHHLHKSEGNKIFNKIFSFCSFQEEKGRKIIEFVLWEKMHFDFNLIFWHKWKIIATRNNTRWPTLGSANIVHDPTP